MTSNFFLIAVLAFGSLVSSGAKAQIANGETVRIQKYPGVISLLLVVAADHGFCAKHGINCKLVTIPSSIVGLQALLTGGLDVATPAVEPALQLASKGTHLRFIGNISRYGPYLFAVGAHVSDPNRSKGFPDLMHDFKGKTVGVTTRGSGTEYVLNAMLAAAGMKNADVTVVAVGGTATAYAALLNHQVDTVVGIPPLGALCEVLKQCHIDVWLNRGEGPKDVTLDRDAFVPLTVQTEYAAANPKVIAALRGALKDAETFIQTKSNFHEVVRIATKDFNMHVSQANAVISTMVRNVIPSLHTEIDPAGVQHAMDYMVRTGQLNHPFDISGLVLK